MLNSHHCSSKVRRARADAGPSSKDQIKKHNFKLDSGSAASAFQTRSLECKHACAAQKEDTYLCLTKHDLLPVLTSLQEMFGDMTIHRPKALSGWVDC